MPCPEVRQCPDPQGSNDSAKSKESWDFPLLVVDRQPGGGPLTGLIQLFQDTFQRPEGGLQVLRSIRLRDGHQIILATLLPGSHRFGCSFGNGQGLEARIRTPISKDGTSD